MTLYQTPDHAVPLNTQTVLTVTLKLHGAACFLDPLSTTVNQGVSHLTGLAAVVHLPAALPNDPNTRPPNLGTAVSKKVYESLVTNDGRFHLKNKGITILAKAVKHVGGDDYEVSLQVGRDGVVDGGHTYALIEKARVAGCDLGGQYVPVSVRVGCSESYLSEICEGLNTGTQVKTTSIIHSKGDYDWLKAIMGVFPTTTIKWAENTSGDWAASDVIAVLTCVHPALTKQGVHPTGAYAGSSKIVSEYRRRLPAYEALEKVVVPTLRLVDLISAQLACSIDSQIPNEVKAAQNKQDQTGAGNWAEKGGRLSNGTKLYKTLFNSTVRTGSARLVRAVYLPALAAFRQLVVTGQHGELIFDRDEKDLTLLYKSLEADFRDVVLKHFQRCGFNTNDLGKSNDFWQAMYEVVTPHTRRSQAVTRLTELELLSYRVLFEEQWDAAVKKLAVAVDDDNTAEVNLLTLEIHKCKHLVALIDSGRFGICSQCFGGVADDRLRASNHADLCEECGKDPYDLFNPRGF